MAFLERDLVIAQLTKTILSQVRNREPLNMLALEDVSLLVSTHLLQHYGNGRGLLRAQPSLEIWQKIRTEEMLRAHLEGEIRIADLATACQLSPSHFSRCFRQSLGTSVKFLPLAATHSTAACAFDRKKGVDENGVSLAIDKCGRCWHPHPFFFARWQVAVETLALCH